MLSSTQLPSVQSFSSAAPFVERMQPLLLQQEPRYGLMLGIALAVARKPDIYGTQPPYFAIAEDSEGVAAAALMTPPRGLIVYSERHDPRPGLQAIANDLASAGWSLPTVNGPEPVCSHFAAIWAEIAKVKAEPFIHLRAFELRQVIHPLYSEGHLRPAVATDSEILAQWFSNFSVEALMEQPLPLERALEQVQNWIDRGTLYVWEHGEVVSMAGTARPTPNGITISAVYTPPHLRGRGYATSCVAQLSQLMLDQGRAFCTLFTDVANPTSNRIYQSIGYQPICDYTDYKFQS